MGIKSGHSLSPGPDESDLDEIRLELRPWAVLLSLDGSDFSDEQTLTVSPL